MGNIYRKACLGVKWIEDFIDDQERIFQIINSSIIISSKNILCEGSLF